MRLGKVERRRQLVARVPVPTPNNVTHECGYPHYKARSLGVGHHIIIIVCFTQGRRSVVRIGGHNTEGAWGTGVGAEPLVIFMV